MAYSDRELLARLIQCEAGGEGENGMKAVAGVVMNRVHARGGEYARIGQGSIRNIIFQPYQFVCASETENGAYNPQNIYNMRPEQIHYDIADWAIAGNRLPDVAESLWFYNPFGPKCRSFFRLRWDTGRPASATTAFIIQQMRTTRLERSHEHAVSNAVFHTHGRTGHHAGADAGDVCGRDGLVRRDHAPARAAGCIRGGV